MYLRALRSIRTLQTQCKQEDAIAKAPQVGLHADTEGENAVDDPNLKWLTQRKFT